METTKTQSIIIYGLPHCPKCGRAEEFFKARGFLVENKDVSRDFKALREMARLAPGQRQTPVLVWQGRIFESFDLAFWQSRLDHAR